MIVLNDFFAKNNTDSLQMAIDAAAEKNEVLFVNKGEYIVTTIFLKGDNTLFFEDGVIIKPAQKEKWKDFLAMPIFLAVDAKNINLSGKATIFGGKDQFVTEAGQRCDGPRAETILLFANSKNITVSGLTLKDSVGWTFHLNNCEDVYVNDVTIRNDVYNKSVNSDGIDINGCRNVVIENCDICTGDDGICLKNIDSTDNSRPRSDMYNIRVRNCVVASTCNATKIGTETVGNIFDVTFENIYVRKHINVDEALSPNPKKPYYDTIAAISVQSNDGAKVYDVTFKNYLVDAVQAPFFILLMNRKTKDPNAVLGEVRNISIDGLIVKKALLTSSINASKGAIIKNVSINNVVVDTFEEKPEMCEEKIPDGTQYPDAHFFGRFRSYGLFVRNVEGFQFGENVIFNDNSESNRPDVYFEMI